MSENAQSALKYATELAAYFNASLVLMHMAELQTIMDHPASSSFEEIDEQEKQEVLSHLEDYCRENLGGTGTGPAATCIAKVGRSATKSILETINETGANLVVVGTRGRSRMRELILGSTVRRLLSESPRPVLAVPPSSNFTGIKHIVYCSEGAEHDFAALETLIRLVEGHGASLTGLQLFDNETEMQAGKESFMRKLKRQVEGGSKIDFVAKVTENHVDALDDYLRTSGVSLVAMFSRENGGFVHKLFHKDMAKQYSRHAQVPVLVFNEKNASIPIN